MSTNNSERLNFQVSAQGSESKEPCKLRIMTLERVNNFIESKRIDAKVKAELMRIAARYPQQALENFIHNFDHHLLKARQASKLSKPTVTAVELGDEPQQQDEAIYAPKIEEFE